MIHLFLLSYVSFSVTMVQQAMTAPSSPSWMYKKYLQSNSLPVRIAERNATDDYSGPALFAADAYVLIIIQYHSLQRLGRYCLSLHVGSNFGKDGKVLWTNSGKTNAQPAYVAYSPSLGIVVSHQGQSIISCICHYANTDVWSRNQRFLESKH